MSRKSLVFVAILVVGTAIGYAIMVQYPSTPKQTSEPYPTVKVSGNAITKGLGATPNQVTFTDEDGKKQSAPVVDGKYETELKNRQSYVVTISWSGIGGIGSPVECQAGTLVLNENSNTRNYQAQC